jgi:hypothetical protein
MKTTRNAPKTPVSKCLAGFRSCKMTQEDAAK